MPGCAGIDLTVDDKEKSLCVDDAKHLLRDSDWQDRTFTDLMTVAGFNSKASFTTLFKNCVVMTPSQYRHTQG
ncbi:hypothetical protein GCM10007052_23380 [Halioglobus japonicus]|nr:hypothetical protein GCM10007052_23380 [Halioglobus japonicus]